MSRTSSCLRFLFHDPNRHGSIFHPVVKRGKRIDLPITDASWAGLNAAMIHAGNHEKLHEIVSFRFSTHFLDDFLMPIQRLGGWNNCISPAALVESRQVQYGVVPVENSTEGAINNTQDCLIDSRVKIIGERIIAIEHSLMVKKGSCSSNVDSIASHKQSLAQCRKWLTQNYPTAKQIECASNAEAAMLARDSENIAAIAGEMAASIYQLEVLQSKIQDQKNNSTRFLVLAFDEAAASTGADKTSILVYTENKPGALFRVLQPFEELQVSLTKIETRPSKKEAWEYVFFIDFEGHLDDEKIISLFASLHSCTEDIKVLGSYPEFRNELAQ